MHEVKWFLDAVYYNIFISVVVCFLVLEFQKYSQYTAGIKSPKCGLYIKKVIPTKRCYFDQVKLRKFLGHIPLLWSRKMLVWNQNAGKGNGE